MRSAGASVDIELLDSCVLRACSFLVMPMTTAFLCVQPRCRYQKKSCFSVSPAPEPRPRVSDSGDSSDSAPASRVRMYLRCFWARSFSGDHALRFPLSSQAATPRPGNMCSTPTRTCCHLAFFSPCVVYASVASTCVFCPLAVCSDDEMNEWVEAIRKVVKELALPTAEVPPLAVIT